MSDEQVPPSTGATGDPATGRRADRSGGSGAGRRGVVRQRRVDVVVVLGMLLPTVVGIGLGLTRGEDSVPWPGAAPTPERLTHSTVVCPAPVTDGAIGDVLVSRVPGVDGGEVDARTSDADPEKLQDAGGVDAAPGQVGRVAAGDGAVVLTGDGAAAPGLVAGRGAGFAAAAECRAPSADEWFVGLGASAEDSSTFELVNPDAGPAVVEIVLFGPRGQIEEPALRGIPVPGHGVRLLDLAQIAPRRVPLAAHLTVTRGQISAAVRQTRDPLGGGQPLVDYLPEQHEPASTNLLLGVPTVGEERTLYLANPGEDEARATLRVVTDEAVFTPAGVSDVEVPPHTVRPVPLTDVLTGQAAEGALGLQVESTAPLVAGVQVVDADLGRIAPVTPVDDPTATIVPAGPKRLVLGAAERAGTVRVTATTADGEVVMDEEPVEVAADQAVALDLPDAAVLVTVEARNTSIAGTIVLTGTASDPVRAQVRLRAAEVYAQVPAVQAE